MKRTLDLVRLSFLAVASGAVLPACNPGGSPAPAAPVAVAEPVKPAPVRREPTEAAALARAREYWAHAEKGDWIAAYDYLAPELQREQPVAAYLQRKGFHIYKNMRVIEVVARKDDQIFLRTGGSWTPNHPEVKKVKLEPGQTLTQEVEMIEIWRWIGEQWCLQRPLRPEEFLEEFPDLQPK